MAGAGAAGLAAPEGEAAEGNSLHNGAGERDSRIRVIRRSSRWKNKPRMSAKDDVDVFSCTSEDEREPGRGRCNIFIKLQLTLHTGFRRDSHAEQIDDKTPAPCGHQESLC